MPSPLLVAAVGAAAAGVFSMLGRQFRAYGTGQRSYVSLLEGNLWLTAIYLVVVCVGSSALLTFLVDGSQVVFWSILAGFVLFVAAVTSWCLARKRR
jgi:hypothetical protein